ncbi:MAG: hypothetical protein NZ583_04595 [Desulfobacterota bacterium]|nr:hypothetical protein [Thermodesulfobacteriota bacterium]MDW8001452.1 hypothetical protein [Deltaproteobacteria bacterium]
MEKSLKWQLLIILSIVFIFSRSLSYAHRVTTLAYREGDKIVGECYFVGGSPCKNAKVEVYAGEKKILETQTDSHGRYSFATKEKGDLRIVVNLSGGHRAQYTLRGNEKEISRKEEDEKTRRIVNEVLESKIHELKTEIRELRKDVDRIGLRDIIGGIGYIFGIWGLISLLKRRKNAS